MPGPKRRTKPRASRPKNRRGPTIGRRTEKRRFKQIGKVFFKRFPGEQERVIMPVGEYKKLDKPPKTGPPFLSVVDRKAQKVVGFGGRRRGQRRKSKGRRSTDK